MRFKNVDLIDRSIEYLLEIYFFVFCVSQRHEYALSRCSMLDPILHLAAFPIQLIAKVFNSEGKVFQLFC